MNDAELAEYPWRYPRFRWLRNTFLCHWGHDWVNIGKHPKLPIQVARCRRCGRTSEPETPK